MASEAGLTHQPQVFVRQQPYQPHPYPQPHLADKEDNPYLPSESDIVSLNPVQETENQNRTSTPWGELGERLNLGQDKIGVLADEDAFGSGSGSNEGLDAPFAMQPGDRRLKDGESMDEAPRAVSGFHDTLEG